MQIKSTYRNFLLNKGKFFSKKQVIFIFPLLLLSAGVCMANSCDTIANIGSGGITLYTFSPDGGYRSGNNIYGNLAYAEKFTGTAGMQVSGTFIGFAYASILAADSSNTVNINVWNNTGSGGSPGNIIATSAFTLKNIALAINSHALIYVPFTSTPILTNTDFFIGLILPTTGDTIALYTNTENPTNGNGWEQESFGLWESYDSAWSLGSQHLGNYIEAITCPVNLGIIRVNGDKQVKIYPNPVDDVLNMEWSAVSDAEITIIDLSGKPVKRFVVSGKMVTTLDIQDLASGAYIIRIIDQQTKELQTMKVVKL